MAVVTSPHAFHQEDLFVDLRSVFEQSLYLKCEGVNLAGSIKLKPAVEMVEAAERDGTLSPGSVIVESSSGNLGVALSMIAANKGYRFLCVTDVRCNTATKKLMQAHGAEVYTVTDPSENGGLLGARIEFIRALCDADNRCVWLNQYGNPNNWRSHYNSTAPAIVREFPRLDVLFVGAGTTGTLMGCARYLRRWHPNVRIVAVDAVGSVTFGSAPERRMIPGLGTSAPPALLDEAYVDDVVLVDEPDAIRTCHRLARRGFLFGGSTGTVISGALRWLAERDTHDLTAVAIAPDFGERYLDTIYSHDWLDEHFPDDMLSPDRGWRSGTSVAAQSAAQRLKVPA